MQIILFRNIERLGMQGDVVNVAPGYYRNFLGPRGIAVEATPATLSRLDAKCKKLREAAEKQLGEADTLAKRLREVQLKYVMKAIDNQKLFGSVHDHDIAGRLSELGFSIERRQIAMHEPIKTVGAHQVRIKLLGHVETQVTVVIEAEAGPAPKAEPKAEPKPEEAPAPPEATTSVAEEAPETQG